MSVILLIVNKEDEKRRTPFSLFSAISLSSRRSPGQNHYLLKQALESSISLDFRTNYFLVVSGAQTQQVARLLRVTHQLLRWFSDSIWSRTAWDSVDSSSKLCPHLQIHLPLDPCFSPQRAVIHHFTHTSEDRLMSSWCWSTDRCELCLTPAHSHLQLVRYI